MDTVPLALAELSKEDAIATVREALDSVGLLDNSGWPADRPCFGPCPPSRTISCGITTDTCYVISHHELMVEPLISPWSGVQLSPLAPDHALLAGACPATQKFAPSCGRSVCKTAARPERRVFPRGCRPDRVSGRPTRRCPDGRAGESDEVAPSCLKREGVHGEAAAVAFLTTGPRSGNQTRVCPPPNRVTFPGWASATRQRCEVSCTVVVPPVPISVPLVLPSLTSTT